MCRKLIFLTCLVVVLGLAASVRGVIEVPPPVTIDTAVEDTHFVISDDTLEVTSTGSLHTTGTSDDERCEVDKGTLLISGGTITVEGRFQVGEGSDGTHTVRITGGSFTIKGEWKMMDDEGGLSLLEVLGGTVTGEQELDFGSPQERDGEIVIGGGTLIVQGGYEEGSNGRDPQVWKDQGWLHPAPGFVEVNIVIQGEGFTITAIPAGPVATDPNPASGARGLCPDAIVLSWTPTDEIAEPNHDVYLDSSFDDVAQATRASHGNVQYYSENQEDPNYTVPAALQLGTTYYWRVDEVDNADPCVWETPIVWSFTTEDGNAYDPDPPDGRRGVNPADMVLRWTPSCVATATQVVYFSTDLDDVNTMNPTAIEDTVSATDNNCPVGVLDTYTSYYWRIKTDTGGNGEVWSFRTGCGGLLMKYSFEGSLGGNITDPVTDDTGNITFYRHEGGGSLTYGDGRFIGTSAVFDSNVGMYRPDTGDNDPLRLDGSQFSIHFWLKPTYLSGFDMDDIQLVGKSEDTWLIQINDPGSGEGRNNSIKVYHTDDDVSTSNNTAKEGEWLHIAVVYDQPDLDIYLNGIWDDEMSRPNPAPADNNHPVGIGCRIRPPEPNESAYRYDQFLNGSIDELKIWDIVVVPVLEVSTNPSPPDLAERLDPCDPNNLVLSWTPGPFADHHDVYFGTDANVVYQGTVDGNMYPEVGNLVLEIGKTYYWRIDDVNGGDTYEGFLWSFSTETAIVDPNMFVWYKFDELYGDDVMDSSGHYLHGDIEDDQDDTWDPCDGRFPGCIHFHEEERIDLPEEVFDYIGESISISVWWKEAWREEQDDNSFCAFGDDDLHMLVRAPDAKGNPGVLWEAGNDTNDVVEWTTNGLTWKNDWHHLVFTKNGPEGTMKIYFDTVLVASTVDANGTTLSQAAASAGDGFRIGAAWGHSDDFAGKADDFRLYDYEISQDKIIELFRGGDVNSAWAPDPYDGEVDVSRDVVLIWRPGDNAAEHDVYFGTDWDDVNDANSSWPVGPVYRGRQEPNNYDPPEELTLETTYYWRIDEVNDPCMWKGKVWKFTVANFLIIDDFESYCTGFGCDNDIIYTWLDGFTQPPINSSGSEVALGAAPIDPVHGGKQSMVYLYDNCDSWGWGLDYYSEMEVAINNLPIGPDWTEAGVKILTLFFYGDADNDANATEQMYVVIEDSTGADSNVQINYGYYGEDNNDIREAEWHQWDIALPDFTDVDLTDVNMLYVGFGIRGNPNPGGTPGGNGTVYFDDVRLYPPKCVPRRIQPEADLNNDCIVDLKDVGAIAEEWLRTDACLPVEVPPSGPVGWWKIEAGAGTTVYDYSVVAPSKDGTLTGNKLPAWVTGCPRADPNNWALEFEDGKVLVGDDAKLRPLAEVSACAWVKLEQSQDHSARVVVKGADNVETFGLEVSDDDDFVWYVRDANGNQFNVEDGVWHWEWIHLAGTFDVDSNTVKCYVNGQLADSRDDANFVSQGLTLSQDTNDLAIGNRSDANDREFEGTIDDVRVYNYALTDAQVAYIATGGTGYVPLTLPVNLYDNEAPGAKVINFKDIDVLLDSWLEVKLWPPEE